MVPFLAEQGILKKHILCVHEGIKPHKCDLCGKAFSRQSAVNDHVKIFHEGIKDFQCDLCGKEFNHKSHLNRHKKNVHEKSENQTLISESIF